MVLESAFGRRAEADLVEQLQGTPGVFSLVASQDGDVVGHVTHHFGEPAQVSSVPCRPAFVADVLTQQEGLTASS